MIRHDRMLFAAASMILLGVLIWAAIDEERRQEWREYQRQYYELVAELSTDEQTKEAAKAATIELQQFFLPRLNRVDRCTSCHLGVEDPAMVDEPQPLSLHPGDHLINHPPDGFGCTVCHQGQGRATNAADAHGHVAHWEKPTFPKELMQASCGYCHPGDAIPGAKILNAGRRMIAELGCRGCHVINGGGGNVGPILTGVASRDVNQDRVRNAKDWEWHFRHFKRPQEVSSDSVMPQLGLTDEQVHALTVAVLSLTGEVFHRDYIFRASPGDGPQRRLATAVERGRSVWEASGCAGCHGRRGKGGVNNPNASDGNVPAIDTIAPKIVASHEQAERLIDAVELAYRNSDDLEESEAPWFDAFEEIRENILDGLEPMKKDEKLPDPPLQMPPWRDELATYQVNDLMAYLVSLYPTERWSKTPAP